MRKKLPGLMATLTLLVFTSPLFAQASGAQGRQMSVFEMFFLSDDILGLIIIWTLLLLSAVTMGFIIKLMIDHRRLTIIPDSSFVELETMLQEKRYREAIEFAQNDPSYLSKLVNSALSEASNGYVAMERAVEESADAEVSRMLRPVEMLNVIGNIAPMMGLFGTVYGMIRAFQTLVALGGKPDPAELAAGISTALVTTFWGLVVAMPALLFYAIIRNKIDALTAEGVLLAEDLIRPFKPSGSGASRRPSGAAAPAGAGSPPPQPSARPKAAPKPA